MNIKNEGKGTIFYGMHMYPGLAQYTEPNGDYHRVYLSEDVIRSMDPSFAGRPVFVLHVDEVEEKLDFLRAEADGWVSESFYNQADGKHWVKFIIVSEKGNKAIANGMKLSNCYLPTGFGAGGTWNGMDYDREITSGTYEHLAIVPNPRYEESIILTPDQFKKYNEDKLIELKRLANSKQGEPKMKFNFFKKAKVENSTDIEGMSVILPESGREITIVKLINEADAREKIKNERVMCNGDEHVKVDEDGEMTVNELLKKYKDMRNELEEIKKSIVEEKKENEGDNEEDKEDKDDKKKNDVEDEEAKKKALELAAHEEKEIEEEKKKNEADMAAAKAAAKEKADKLRNANFFNALGDESEVNLSCDMVERGRSRYGS